MLRAKPIDLMLLAWPLGKDDSLAVCRGVKADAAMARTPIVLVVNSISDAGRQQGLEVRARLRGSVQGERAQLFQRSAKVRVLFEPGILEDRLDIPFFPACGRDTHDGV